MPAPITRHNSMLRATAALLLCAALLAGCGDAETCCLNDGNGDAGGQPASGYAAVSAILGGTEQAGSGSCAFAATCHGGTGAGKAQLNFKAGADLHEVLVNVPACENDAMMRVTPGDPEHSWLWLKLTAEIMDDGTGRIVHDGTPSACSGVSLGFGTRMPKVPGYAKLADDKLAVIRAWIEDGAPGPK